MNESVTTSEEQAVFVRPNAIEWAMLLIGSVLLLRYSWFLDDSFIYFRYADNLLFLDLGLVYNAGEYVEGYSSPLWMLLMVVMRSVGADWWLIVRVAGLLSYAAFFLVLVAVNRHLSPSRSTAVNLPLVFMGANYAVMSFFTSGLETPIVQLEAVCFALYVLRPRSRLMQTAVGLAALVRHEFLLPLLVVAAYDFRKTRRVPWLMLGIAAGSMAVWLLFRVYYYADLLPNTFYLKDSTWYEQGWLYLRQVITSHWLWLVVPGGAAMLWFGTRRAPEDAQWHARLVMVLIALPVLVYVVRIGGAATHYRYLAFPVCLILASTGGSVEWLRSQLARGRARWIPYAAAGGIGLFALALYPPQLLQHPLLTPRDPEARLRNLVDGIHDPMSHRLQPDFVFSPWTLDPMLEQRELYRTFLESEPDWSRQPMMVEGWCYANFRAFDTRILHEWGLTDPILARVHVPWQRPGHRKGLRDYARNLKSIREFTRYPYEPGAFQGVSAFAHYQGITWIADNVETLTLLEHKMFNQHELWPNLRLALQRVPAIQL